MPVIAYGKIKPLRQAKGLNQAEIAAELGISRPTYVLMEQGEKEPTLSQLYTLARLLGVDPEDLCTNLPSVTIDAVDFAKFKGLVSFCAERGSRDGKITKTKLAILLYLIDFSWYNSNSRPMTGMTYRLSERGPVADSYFRALDALYEAQNIALEPAGTSMLVRPVEKLSPKLLNQEELELADKICTKWANESTEDIMSFVRQQIPCKDTKLDDPIPYELVMNQPKESLY